MIKLKYNQKVNFDLLYFLDLGRLMNMSDKETYQNSHRKCPLKNCRGSYQITVAFQDVKSPFMMQIESKLVYDFINYQNIQHYVRNGCKLLKSIGVLLELINLVQQLSHGLWNSFNSKQIWVSLWIGKNIFTW